MKSTISLPDQFEHDFSYEANGQLCNGAQGTLTEIAIQAGQIKAVFGLNFDLDIKDFYPSFAQHYQPYLALVCPQLGLIQTSATGNLHGYLLFQESITSQRARKYHRFLKDFLFADGASSFTMARRQPGSINSKHGDGFVVQELQTASKISQLEIDLLRLPAQEEGSALPRWLERSFRALFQLLSLDGQPYWREGRTNGICPIHGSGNNPNQAAYHPATASIACFGDCRQGQDSPQSISYRQILEELVFNSDLSDRFQLADSADGPLIWQPNSSQKNQELVQRLSASQEYVRMGRQLFKICQGEMISLADYSAQAIGKSWATSITVRRYDAKTGDLTPYHFTAAEVESILLNHIKSFPEVRYRLHRSALNQQQQWTPGGLDGAYFTTRGIQAEIPAAGQCPLLQSLLDMWSWKTQADRTNAAATLLNRIFSAVSDFDGKHLVTIISGNQQGVGKTEFANCVLMLAQGSTNALLTEQEVVKGDFERSLVPKIKDQAVSALLVDNVVGGRDGKFNSTNIVPLITNKRLAGRLFHSQNQLNLPNNFQWLLTTNGASYSKDLIERSILVEIQYVGDPIRRQSNGSPLQLVEENIEPLQAELKGLYLHWIELGGPEHRLAGRNPEFFSLMNSILVSNGFHSFDANRNTLRQSSADAETDLLYELISIITSGIISPLAQIKSSASQLVDGLEESTKFQYCGAGSRRSQETKLGKCLTRLVGREIWWEGKTYRFNSGKVNNGHKFFFQQVEIKDPEEEDHFLAPTLVANQAQTLTESSQPELVAEEETEQFSLGGDLNEIFDA